MPDSAEEIIEKVDQSELDTVLLRERMDEDYARWIQEPFNEKTVTGRDSGKGFKQYTSNDARVFGRKAISMVTSSVMNARTPQGEDTREERERDNAKEQFFLGNMHSNDERLARATGQANALRATLGWYSALRGYTFTRAIYHSARGRNPAFFEARPWDPRHVMWEMSDDGLLWVCNKTLETRASLRDKWGSKIPDDQGDANDQLEVYDYWNRKQNTVIVKDLPGGRGADGRFSTNGVVKIWTDHPMVEFERVPIVFGASNVQPMVQTDAGTPSGGEMWLHFGESIFAENRRIWDVYQHLMSILWELAARGRKPVISIKSPSGIRTLEFDPFIEGAEFPLGPDEEFIIHDLLKAAADTAALLAVVSGEGQRGAFSAIMYGDSPLAISGFAMNTLRSSVSEKVVPLAEHQANVLTQVSNMWVDQFVAGIAGADGIELSGMGSNRKWFSEKITPEQLRDLPELVITLTPQMPADDIQNVQMAQQMRQPGPTGVPLMSDQRILEKYLQMQDSDLEIDEVMVQLGHTAHPEAQLFTLWNALAKRKDPLVKLYFTEWLRIQNAKQQGLGNTPGLPGGLGSPGQGAGGGEGFSPQVAPNAVQGQPTPTPTPQQGPLVSPGTPRPGARNGTLPGP